MKIKTLILIAAGLFAIGLAGIIYPFLSHTEDMVTRKDYNEAVQLALRATDLCDTILRKYDTLDTQTTFYNGEGDTIPLRIVKLEVQSHFVKMTPAEMDSIHKYFYLDKP